MTELREKWEKELNLALDTYDALCIADQNDPQEDFKTAREHVHGVVLSLFSEELSKLKGGLVPPTAFGFSKEDREMNRVIKIFNERIEAKQEELK